MGVFGLQSYILRSGAGSVIAVKPGSMIVDFHSFIFWIVENVCSQSNDGKGIQMLECSDFSMVIDTVLLFLKVSEANGIQMEFIADGKHGSGDVESFNSKVDTWKKRRLATSNEMRSTRLSIETARCGPVSVKGIGPGLFLALRHALRLEGYPIYSCNGEADRAIPYLAQFKHSDFRLKDAASPLNPFFSDFICVLTTDTDLCFMKDVDVCLLVQFATSTFGREVISKVKALQLEAVRKGVSSIPNSLMKIPFVTTITLHSSANLARKLGLREADLPVVASLTGNDFCPNLVADYRGKIELCAAVIRGASRRFVRLQANGMECSVDTPNINLGSASANNTFHSGLGFNMFFYRQEAGLSTPDDDDYEFREFAAFRKSAMALKFLNHYYSDHTEPLPTSIATPELQSVFRTISLACLKDRLCKADGTVRPDVTMTKFLRMATLLASPSLLCAIQSPNRANVQEIMPDYPSSFGSAEHAVEYMTEWRRKLYVLLLSEERSNLSVTEWRYTESAATVLYPVDVSADVLAKAFPSFRKILESSDRERLSMFATIFFSHIKFPSEEEMCSSSAAMRREKLLADKFCFGMAGGIVHPGLLYLWKSLDSVLDCESFKRPLLATVMVSLTSHLPLIEKRWRVMEEVELGANSEHKKGKSIFADRLSYLDSFHKKNVSTASGAGVQLLMLDLERYLLSNFTVDKIKKVIGCSALGDISAHIRSLVFELSRGAHCASRVLFPGPELFTIWSRFVEMMQCVYYPLSFFLIHLNLPATFEEFFNFVLFQCFAQRYLNYRSPEFNMYISPLIDSIMRILDTAPEFLDAEEVLNAYTVC